MKKAPEDSAAAVILPLGLGSGLLKGVFKESVRGRLALLGPGNVNIL